jgi:DNA-binding XRE family transcriptional regulator
MIRLVIILRLKKTIVSNFIESMVRARRAADLTQEKLAERAGVSRVTVYKMETENIDPRLSTVEEIARAMGYEIMLVPKTLRTELEGFIRSNGKLLGQPTGIDAPRSLVDDLISPPSGPGHKR